MGDIFVIILIYFIKEKEEGDHDSFELNTNKLKYSKLDVMYN